MLILQAFKKVSAYGGDRWNGYAVPFTITTYMGFMPSSLRISVQSIDYSADKSEATVTFNCSPDYLPSIEQGTIRVEKGTIHPRSVTDGNAWNTSTRENAFESYSVTIKENGDYTVRIANSNVDENYCMAYFSVTGLQPSSGGDTQVGIHK